MEFAQKDLQVGSGSAPATALQLAPLCGSYTQERCRVSSLWMMHSGAMQILLKRTCRYDVGYSVSAWQSCG